MHAGHDSPQPDAARPMNGPSSAPATGARSLQLNADGELHHLLSIEELPRTLIERILTTADGFIAVGSREIKSVPLLRGRSVFNLFFENSTRTRTTFEIAAKRLSADVINLDIARSSTAKGESL